MTTGLLYEQLKNCSSEEDVKDAYIKALGLTGVRKNLIDIQTNEIWFEAKSGSKISSYEMFTQLLHYVQLQALDVGIAPPPFLAVIDQEKAAIMRTADALPLLEKKIVKWGKSASGYTKEAVETVSAHIGTHLVSFRIKTHEEEFIAAVKGAIKKGEIIRAQITPANIKQVFDKWVDMIGREIGGVKAEDYALLFFADIMSDGTRATHQDLPAQLLHKDGSPAFMLNSKLYELGNKEGYRQFWSIYHRPPKEEHRNYLLERRDNLIPLDERSFKGAYYTPLHVVDKAYDLLAQTLGDNWQDEYIVWDMCCGVGNLEVKHGNPRNVFMSTLDQADIDVMKATRTMTGSERFQYDYLNDDITDGGSVDYTLTNKLPERLRKAIANGKKILVLINPPYGEAGSSDTITSDGQHKTDIANTKIAEHMTRYGYATRELFTQFLARVAREMPHATIAMFSKLKYVNAPNFEAFRTEWNASYLGGFVVHSKAFDGLKGNFPIGFLIWQTNLKSKVKTPIVEIAAEVLDKDAEPIGAKKFYNIPSEEFLSEWFKRPRSNNDDALPLKNAITPATVTKDLRGSKWSDGAIGSMLSNSNMLQNASTLTALFSSGFGSAGAFFVNPENLWQSAVVFSVRRLIKPTWLNDRDQFLQPSEPLTEDFKNDCLIWMLFNGSNLTASANDLEWGGKNGAS